MEKLEKLCKIILKASHEEIWALVKIVNKIHLENYFFIINQAYLPKYHTKSTFILLTLHNLTLHSLDNIR